MGPIRAVAYCTLGQYGEPPPSGRLQNPEKVNFQPAGFLPEMRFWRQDWGLGVAASIAMGYTPDRPKAKNNMARNRIAHESSGC